MCKCNIALLSASPGVVGIRSTNGVARALTNGVMYGMRQNDKGQNRDGPFAAKLAAS